LVAPCLVGGEQAPTPLDGAGARAITAPLRLREVEVQPLGDDVAIAGYLEA
jgi:riboflavin biosynthesis pyrimidine reductase